ncbi:MAG: hypothetical protein LPK02_07695 [Rhodobacterales bacterium]|nr:hypothetical protein [Rhodobacterales bacterium]
MLKTINTPSSQDDWITWAGNQGTHILLGMVLSSFIGPTMSCLIYIFGKEMRDVVKGKGTIADSLTDSFYFGTGAWVIFAIMAGSSVPASLSIAFVFLAFGAFIRAHLDNLTFR